MDETERCGSICIAAQQAMTAQICFPKLNGSTEVFRCVIMVVKMDLHFVATANAQFGQ
jgi:hypothetical protein